MTTVYTFCSKNKTTDTINKPSPLQRSVTYSDTSIYQFKKPIQNNDKLDLSKELDTEKKNNLNLEFNDTNFPVLGSNMEKKLEQIIKS
jgi:hypothetical protein